ncbi:MAG: hypothetical protein WCJ02_17765, partial [bacterium]
MPRFPSPGSTELRKELQCEPQRLADAFEPRHVRDAPEQMCRVDANGLARLQVSGIPHGPEARLQHDLRLAVGCDPVPELHERGRMEGWYFPEGDPPPRVIQAGLRARPVREVHHDLQGRDAQQEHGIRFGAAHHRGVHAFDLPAPRLKRWHHVVPHKHEGHDGGGVLD